MAVHMIRFLCSADAQSFLVDSYLPQWLTTHTAWELADNQPPQVTDPYDYDTRWYAADWRFAWTASREVLMSNLVAYTRSYAPWHLIGYHVCDHDEDERSSCPPWDDSHPDVEIYESGTVPEEVTL